MPLILQGSVVKSFEFVLFPRQIADELIKYAWTDLGMSRLAEAVRFELTEGVNPRRFSRPVP